MLHQPRVRAVCVAAAFSSTRICRTYSVLVHTLYPAHRPNPLSLFPPSLSSLSLSFLGGKKVVDDLIIQTDGKTNDLEVEKIVDRHVRSSKTDDQAVVHARAYRT